MPHLPAQNVSILVFVEVALGLYIAPATIRFDGCFNPCFRGSRPRTQGGLGIGRVCVSMFQSLFSWKSPSDGRERLLSDQISRVSILVFVEVALGLSHQCNASRGFILFQSLFSWKSPSDLHRDCGNRHPDRFQSLFSWKSPSDAKIAVIGGTYSSFNPCFRGSRPRTSISTSSPGRA